MIGGAFNSLVAPRVFHSTVEYPIAMLLCAALAILWPLTVPATQGVADRRMRFVRGMVIVVLVATTLYAIAESRMRFNLSPNSVIGLLGVPMVLCFVLRRRPIAFGLCTGTLAGSMLALGFSGHAALETHRSFFGVHRVMFDSGERFVQLYHGTTLHGEQTLDPATHLPIEPERPLTYYHRDGPLGDVFACAKPMRVGVVGLGVGNVAAYLNAGQAITYFEIDPVVIALAQRPDRFTFLSAARERGVSVRIVPGDARLTLADQPEPFDLLILDAFSGDAIPAHLLTREAFALYAQRLAPGGTLAVHISNRYLDLRHVVASGAVAIAQTALIRDESLTPEIERTAGRVMSTWMMIPRDSAATDALRGRGWSDVPAGGRPWSDDFIDLLGTLK